MTATTGKSDFVADAFQQSADLFAAALRTGVKFCEDSARFWLDLAGRSAEQVRARVEKFNDEAVPFSQKNLERFQRTFDEQATRTLELLKQSFEAGRARNPSELFDRLMALWRSSLDTIRGNADAMARLNAELLEKWAEFSRLCGAPDGKPAGKRGAK